MQQKHSWPALRVGAVTLGVLLIVLGAGYALNLSVATNTWPWPDGPLSHLFVGSILAAVAVAFIWIGLLAEWGAIGAGAITVLVMTGGWAGYLYNLYGLGRHALLPFAIWFSFVAAASGAALVWSRRLAIRDTRTMPLPLRLSFGLFVAVLIFAGTSLVLRLPIIMPWPVNPDSSVMFGFIFLGDACYFCYSLLNPRWHNARGQLLSFLAYDIVLIPPFIGLFATVKPAHFTTLVLYMAVLVYSALLAIYYLFIDRNTRSWAIQA